jgi:hypothetical protein
MLLALLCAAGFAACTTALAQTTPPATSGTTPTARTTTGAPAPPATTPSGRPAPAAGAPKQQTTARSESVLRRPLADAPEGIPVGDFVMHLRGEVDLEYDDNIYRVNTGAVGDVVARFRPGVTLQSQWDEHAIDFYVQAEHGRYFSYTSENYTALALGTRGRYDVNEETQINGLLEYARSVLPRGSPGVGTTPGSSTASVIRAATDVTYQGEPWYVRAGPLYEYRFYEGEGPSDNHHYVNLLGRVGYRINEEFSVFVDPSYQFVKYVTVPDSTGFNRNSQGFDIKVGFTYDLTTTVGVEAAIGYYRRWYEDSRLLPDGGLSARASLYWNPTETLSFELEARRQLTEYRLAAGPGVGTTASGNAVETSIGGRVGYLAMENLLLDAGLTWAQYEYNGIGRFDNYWGFDIGAKYFFNQYFFIGPRYYYSNRRSTDGPSNYNDNRILLTLGARL